MILNNQIDLHKIFTDETQLLPVVVQEVRTNQVLMLAYMNLEAMQRTLKTGLATFWSRTRSEIWEKGSTSGNYLKVKSLSFDCDLDSILIRAELTGSAVCHTGQKSCFFNHFLEDETTAEFSLETLFNIIEARRMTAPDDSYTSGMMLAGSDVILDKIQEEIAELKEAVPSTNEAHKVWEAADVIYHLLMYLSLHQISYSQVVLELKKRNLDNVKNKV